MKKSKNASLIILCLGLSCNGLSTQAEEVTLREEQLQSIGPLGWIAPNFELPNPKRNDPLVDPKVQSSAASLLRRYQAQGIAGGLEGVIYDNRDRDHSKLPQSEFPQLLHLTYGPNLRAKDLDYGLAGRIILPAIVIGNSSTALTQKHLQRSQTRFAMTTRGGPERAFLTYSNNHLYVYPEHRDHDLADVFPANWPYTLNSQGSSHSDMPFVKALVLTMAAFRDETRQFLEEKRLIAPTLQMIFRRSQKGIYTPQQYLSGIAHPTVFEASRLAPERMVAMAAALKADDVPPMLRLGIEREDFSDSAGLAGLSERLFSTPSAIARIWRSEAYSRTMIVSANKTQDPNNRDLVFEWILLRGDAQKVRITPLNKTNSSARIDLDWHGQWRFDPSAERTTNRVDIGVFASNGSNYSAPGFISISFPQHQFRTYQPIGARSQMRLISVDYAAKGDLTYFDPLLHWTADWRDEFEYSSEGDLIRWKRILSDETLILTGAGIRSNQKDPMYELETRNGRPQLYMKESRTQQK